MTSVREDLGYVEHPRPFKPRPPVARYEGVREAGAEGWEAEVLKADGRRIWLYDSKREAAIARARNYVAANGGGK